MILERNLVLQRDGLKPILYDISYQENNSLKPIVIFCHGYKGYKDWGAWRLVAKQFAEQGCFFLKFNFSHNGGTIDQPIDFPDLKAFGQNNFSKEIQDLEDILKLIKSENNFKEEIDVSNISLIAHSRGGGIVMIKAAEDPSIKNVITWAGVSDFKVRFQENTETFSNWKKNGITYIENSRTKQQMPHEFQFYEDFIANEKRFTIKNASKNLKTKLLIIHGSQDTSVPLIEAERLHQWNPNSELVILKDADHVFGSCQPWKETSLPKDLNKVVNNTLRFIQ